MTALLVVLRRPLPRPVAAVAALVLTLLTWQTASLVAKAGVDPSWRVALHLAHLQGIHFGPDFVWTYGPLGYLAFPLAVSGGTLAAALVSVLVAQTGLGYLLVRRSGVVFGGALSVVAAYAVLRLPTLPADFPTLIVVGLALWSLAEPTGLVRRLFPYGGGALAAVAVLTKTNMGIAALAVVVVACAARGWRRVLEAVVTSILVFVVLWLASGNSLTDIPQWWRLSLSLVTGYSAAMQTEQHGLHNDYAFAALVLLPLTVATWSAALRLRRREAVATVLIVVGVCFASFKESFVRHDVTHAPAFFASAAVVLACLGPGGRVRSAAGSVGLALVVIALSGHSPVEPWVSARRLVAQVGDTVDSSRRAALVERSHAGERRSYDVPPVVLGALRGRTVHVDPWEVSAISAYALRWRPVPVPQSYSAYTSVLDERNASFLASARAPQRILRENPAELVNGRDRSLEAPATYRAILCDYRQVLRTTRWQVLVHDPRCGAPRHLATLATAAGQPVAVPEARADELVVAHVDLHDSLANRLRGLLYKPHEAVVSLGGGPFTAVAAAVVRDGIVVHVPGNAGFDPRFGGAIDWRTIAAGGLKGSISVSFDAYRISGAGPRPVGVRASPPLPRYTLERRGGGDAIVTPAGRVLPVAQGGGFVDYGYVRRGTLVLSGWAADVATGVPARMVLVFADGRLVFAGPPTTPRPDVAAALGKPGLRHAGYAVLVPEQDVRVDGGRRDVRIVALVGGQALEVEYPLSYGWRRR
ncbi:MAG TPA: hypothetical protein VIK66_06055 [Gaiellaceae bacterium]